MCEPTDDWPRKFDESLELERSGINFSPCQTIHEAYGNGTTGASDKVESEFTFPCGPSAEDAEEVTESKIRAFLDEKVLFCAHQKFCRIN